MDPSITPFLCNGYNDKDYDYIVTPFAEHIPKAFHMHYGIFWGIVGLLFTGAYTAVQVRGEGPLLRVIWPSLTLGLLPFAIIIATIYFSKILEKFTPSLFSILEWEHQRTLDWYSDELRAIFSNKWMFLCGVLNAFVIYGVAYKGPVYPTEATAQTTFMFLMALLGFISGGAVYSLLRIVVMLDRLGKTGNVRISVYQHPLTSIKAIGALMTKISTMALCLYLLGISYSLTCPNTLPTLLATAAFGGVIAILFIAPQVRIHRIMTSVKHERLINFSSYLEKALENVIAEPSDRNISQARRLLSVQNSLNQMDEWPFNTKMVVKLVTGIVVPIAAMLVPLVCTLLQKG